MDPPRDPSKFTFQAANTRRSIIAAYWVIIILAAPLWWSTTSIQRLPLPSDRIFSQAKRGLRLPVHIQLEDDGSRSEITSSPSFAAEVQSILDNRARDAPRRWEGVDVTISVHTAAKNAPPEGSSDLAGKYTIRLGGSSASVHNRTLSIPYGGLDSGMSVVWLLKRQTILCFFSTRHGRSAI